MSGNNSGTGSTTRFRKCPCSCHIGWRSVLARIRKPNLPVKDVATAFKDTTVLLRATICLQVAALIICLVGFGTNYLVYYESRGYYLSGGLWKVYVHGVNERTDDFLRRNDYSTESLDPSKTMMGISVGAHILGIILTLGSTFITANKMVVGVVASVQFASALSGIVGCSVAVAFLETALDANVGSSFIMFLVAQFVFVGTGLLLLLDSRLRSASQPGNPAPTLQITTIF